MIGCRYNAKNTLDKNYLYFAQAQGTVIQAESEVMDVYPLSADGSKAVNGDGSHGYGITWRTSTGGKGKGEFKTKGIVFSAGVMGTVKLLLKLKKKNSLPNLSDRLGADIRTNSEAIIVVTSSDESVNHSKGVAIGSILNTDDHSHLEPVRYPPGSGFWRLLMMPQAVGNNIATRLFRVVAEMVLHPIESFKTLTVKDWAKQSVSLLFMQSIDSTLKFKRGLFGMMTTSLDNGPAPTAFIPEAKDLADRYGKKINGKPMTLLTETLFGIPTTAHILGGSVMGSNVNEGVIDKNQNVFGYKNMLVCDGSAISANVGVNPSLTITALSERAMSKIANKVDA